MADAEDVKFSVSFIEITHFVILVFLVGTQRINQKPVKLWDDERKHCQE